MAQDAQRTFDELWARTGIRQTTTRARVGAVPALDRAPAARTQPDLTREQAIEQIRALNPSATVAFLNMFEAPALLTYLEHLLAAQEPRGRAARWERPGGSPAITAWVSPN